jgi:hypothetical protein
MAKRDSVNRQSVRGKTRSKTSPAARKRRIWTIFGWAAVWLVVAVVVITLVTGRFPIRVPTIEMPTVRVPALKMPKPSAIIQGLRGRALLDVVYLVAFSWATGWWAAMIFGWLADRYSPTGTRAHPGYELREMKTGRRVGRATERQVYEWQHAGAGSWSSKIARGRRRIRRLGLPVAVVAVVLLVTRPGSLLLASPAGLADLAVPLVAFSAVVVIVAHLIMQRYKGHGLSRPMPHRPDGRPDLRYMSTSWLDLLWDLLPIITLVAGLVLIVSFCVPAVRALIAGHTLAISSGVFAAGLLVMWYREYNPLVARMSKAAKKEEELYRRLEQTQDPDLDEQFLKILEENVKRGIARRR